MIILSDSTIISSCLYAKTSSTLIYPLILPFLVDTAQQGRNVWSEPTTTYITCWEGLEEIDKLPTMPKHKDNSVTRDKLLRWNGTSFLH